MSDATVQAQGPAYRFFCHRCNLEFEDVLQDYTCPFCSTGFIERLEHNETLSSALDDEEYNDADMSNIEDTSRLGNTQGSLHDLSQTNNAPAQPMLNDLAFLMTGGRIRGAAPRRGESRTLMEQLVWMIGGGRGGGAVTAGAPFVLVGAPGDYVFGGEGLDAVVTHLLGQLENSGPPPLPRDQIQAIPSEQVSQQQVDAAMACSVCWDNFNLGETVSRLQCEHIFHPACITPWLQLHATCPICRRELITRPQQGTQSDSQVGSQAGSQAGSQVGSQVGSQAGSTTGSQADSQASSQPISVTSGDAAVSNASSSTDTHASDTRDPIPAYSRVVVRRLAPRRRRPGSDSSVSSRGIWSALASHLASDGSRTPSSRGSDRERDIDAMYMDIDFD